MRLAKITIALVAIVILTSFTVLGVKSGATTHEINFSQPRLESTEEKLENINLKYEKLNTQLKLKSSQDKETIEQLKVEQQQLEQKKEQEKQELQRQLQAKADEKERLRIAAADAAKKLTATSTASAATRTYSGSHSDWMSAAGISSSDYSMVEYIVMKESGWRPNARNSSSGAHGLCQALPASKMASAGGDYLTNPVTQLKWCDGYAKSRYGGWGGAYNFWLKNHWW